MGRPQCSCFINSCIGVFLYEGGKIMLTFDKKRDDEQRKKLVEKVLSYQYQGEVYIITPWTNLEVTCFKIL